MSLERLHAEKQTNIERIKRICESDSSASWDTEWDEGFVAGIEYAIKVMEETIVSRAQDGVIKLSEL